MTQHHDRNNREENVTNIDCIGTHCTHCTHCIDCNGLLWRLLDCQLYYSKNQKVAQYRAHRFRAMIQINCIV